MSLDRPTYHESWYRVADAKPKLRAFVQSFRHRYRGVTWHVLRDPSNNKFFRLHTSAYQLVGLLDGRHTVGEAWAIVSERFGDDAPTQGETLQLIGQLYVSNLLEGDLPADAAGLFRRYRKRVRKEVGGYIMNLLFARFPIMDPNRLLDALLPLARWFFGPVGVVVWLALLIAGGWQLLGAWPRLAMESQSILQPDNLLPLYAGTILAKILHELGHGFACKRFGEKSTGGGEVHTLGIMLVAFIPMPYVDASSAWALRSKWQRCFVGAAGMYVELALAAVAAIIWANTAEGVLLHRLCYNLMFVAGMSALLFNANPLIKFDGYYILSDLLETPNLQQRGREALQWLWKKTIGGIRRPHRPFQRINEAVLLMIYSVAATIYRVFLTVAIALFVTDRLPEDLLVLAVPLVLSALIALLITPIFKGIKYLLVNPELSRTRGRAVLGTAVLIGGVIAALGWIKLPDHGRAEGVVEAERTAVVYAQVDGTLPDGLSAMGAIAAQDAVLGQIENPVLAYELQELQAKRDELIARRRLASTEETAMALILDDQVAALQEQLDALQQDIERLTLRAPIAGDWVPIIPAGQRGLPVRRGDELGTVHDRSALIIRVAASQADGPRLLDEAGPGTAIELRVRGRADALFTGTVTRVMPAGQRQMRSQALTDLAGGSITTEQDQRGNVTATESYFDLVITPDIDTYPDDAAASHVDLLPGQRVVVRFPLRDTSLLQRGYLAARQMLQRRFQL